MLDRSGYTDPDSSAGKDDDAAPSPYIVASIVIPTVDSTVTPRVSDGSARSDVSSIGPDESDDSSSGEAAETPISTPVVIVSPLRRPDRWGDCAER